MIRQEIKNPSHAPNFPGDGPNASPFELAWRATQQHLLIQRSPEGCWPGYLSSSALSTATAIMALDESIKAGVGTGAQQSHRRAECEAGWAWLIASQTQMAVGAIRL